VLRMGIRQPVPEQIRLQRGLGVLRNQDLERHPQFLSRLRFIQLLLHILYHKPIAQGLLGGRISGLIQYRIHRRQAMLLENLLQIQLLRQNLVIGNDNGRQIAQRIGIQHPVPESLGIQMPPRRAAAKHQSLAVFGDDGRLPRLTGLLFIAAQIRTLPLHLDRGLGQGALQICAQLIHSVLNVTPIQRQVLRRLHRMGAQGRFRPGTGAIKHVAVPPILAGGLRQGLGIQANLGIFRRQHQVPVLKPDDQRLAIQGLGLFCQGRGGLLLGHAAQVHIQGIYIVKNQTIVPGIAPQKSSQPQNHHRQHSRYGNHHDLPPFAPLGLRVLLLPRLPVWRATGRLGHPLKIRFQPRPLLGGTAPGLCKLTLFDIHRSYLQRILLRLFFPVPLLGLPDILPQF